MYNVHPYFSLKNLGKKYALYVAKYSNPKAKYLKNVEFHPTVNSRSFPGANHFPGVEGNSKALTGCLRGVEKKQHSLKEKSCGGEKK